MAWCWSAPAGGAPARLCQGTARCRMPPPRWPPDLLQDGHGRPPTACWTPVPRPGGKTAHLLERAALDLLALDVDARALRTHPRQPAAPGPAGARCCVPTPARPADWWDGQRLTPSCSTHPARPRASCAATPTCAGCAAPGDVEQLAPGAAGLLEALWPLLKPGGRLVYAPARCSGPKAKNRSQAFLERHTDAVHRPSVGHLLPGLAVAGGQFNDNVPGGYDGFFYARIDKAGLIGRSGAPAP
jgi:16S rRNA (cytosine967-C5)-methyltransferase